MTNRIDHAADASSNLAKVSGREPDMALVFALAAQAQATLALVEQQRIANLVALASLAGADATHEELEGIAYSALAELVEYRPTSLEDEALVVPAGIAAALGIEVQ